MNSYDILVIILSISLAVFLIIGIVFLSLMITLVRRINRITAKAELIVDNIESFSETAKKFASPVALFSAIAKLMNTRK